MNPVSIKALGLIAITAAIGSASCGGSQAHQRALAADLRPVSERLDDNSAPLPSQGQLENYLTYAMARSPALRARYEQWRAAVARVGASDKLPEPTLSYGLFIRHVETRVGPQRHRFGLNQRLPWPGKLSSASDAAAAKARAAEQRFEAELLDLRRAVSVAWWRLWTLNQTRHVRREQRALLQLLAASARGRLAIGEATLSEVNQIDLAAARLSDTLDTLDAHERATSAQLAAIIGAPAGSPTPIASQPFTAASPAEDEQTLLSAAEQHPLVQEQTRLMEQSQALKTQAQADRYPNMALGLSYIETGESDGPMVPEDNGKDPIIASVSIELPIWLDAYAAAERSADAQRRARAARRSAVQNTMQAQLLDALALLRDSKRRVRLFHSTLIPQAETTYIAVLGDYEAGRATIATMLLAYRELLELRLGLVMAQADHARAWVRLESAAGRPVQAEQVAP